MDRRTFGRVGSMNPSVGHIVHYVSRGDGVASPALVLRTRMSTIPALLERWGPGTDGTLSGVGRPDGLIAELPDDTTIDLLVHGLGGDYREYAVSQQEPVTIQCGSQDARTWHWPERDDD